MRPAAATCCRRPRAPRGFTLIEVLVVLVVLSVALSLVVVKLTRDRGSLLEEDGRRLALLLQFAHDNAITGGRALAWTANAEGYAFARRDRGPAWVPLIGDDALRPRSWPAEVAVARLRIAGLQAPPGEPLIFSASGINPPYDIMLASGPWRVTLSGDLSGSVALSRATADDAARP